MNLGNFLGGQEWAQQVAPELRRRCQRDTLENYISEIGRKYAHA